MKATEIHRDEGGAWIVFGRDAEKPPLIIDTNQYMIRTAGHAFLLDPGGIELFAPMLAAVLEYAPIEEVTHLFASHQDPDIISSLGLWDRTLPDAKLYAPWLWEGFIRHFGCESIEYEPLSDEGGSVEIDGRRLEFVPAHYLHASGNFNVYDPRARILMSGDIGAALEPAGAPMFVEDFAGHIRFMEGFHKRWMPSNAAKNDWVGRVREMRVDIMAPQHGRLFKGDDVQRFLDWFEALEVGTGLAATRDRAAAE